MQTFLNKDFSPECMQIHKAYFKEPTKAQISRYQIMEANDNLVERIIALEEQESLCIQRPLIPEDYHSSWHFLKHAERVHMRFRDLIPRFIKKGNTAVPVDLRIKEFDAVKERAGIFSGYDYTPVDIRPYNLSLIHI